MREIKCRGFSLLGKKWVYGSYFKSDHSSSGHCILNESGLGHHEVDQKSVGQYTGLKDKNGVEIYEGDIVMAFSVFDMTYNYCFDKDKEPEKIYQICFDDGCFQFKNTKQWSDGANDWRSIENVELFKVEVIGNIYENPELLKAPN